MINCPYNPSLMPKSGLSIFKCCHLSRCSYFYNSGELRVGRVHGLFSLYFSKKKISKSSPGLCRWQSGLWWVNSWKLSQPESPQMEPPQLGLASKFLSALVHTVLRAEGWRFSFLLLQEPTPSVTGDWRVFIWTSVCVPKALLSSNPIRPPDYFLYVLTFYIVTFTLFKSIKTQ